MAAPTAGKPDRSSTIPPPNAPAADALALSKSVKPRAVPRSVSLVKPLMTAVAP